jgi:hypothetical protein
VTVEHGDYLNAVECFVKSEWRWVRFWESGFQNGTPTTNAFAEQVNQARMRYAQSLKLVKITYGVLGGW